MSLPTTGQVVALTGGVGGAKLADGLARLLPAGRLTVVVNTGDDFDHHGLRICPDIDSVLYALSGRESAERGWGRDQETWHVQAELRALGEDAWFQLGDKDLALHLLRTGMLRAGASLSAVTGALTERMGVTQRVMPMSETPVASMILTPEGELPFQHYFVRRRCEPRMLGLRLEGIEQARPPDAVRAALVDPALQGVILCPSNPYVSLGPLLAVPGMRELLRSCRAPVVAVSPIIGGQALKGPAAKMMAEHGETVSALSVARLYAGLVDVMIVDEADADLPQQRRPGDPALHVAPAVMRSQADRVALARVCLEQLATHPARRHVAANGNSPQSCANVSHPLIYLHSPGSSPEPKPFEGVRP
jgi:LPPG:FO 2-phospho-L-lactate transferase